MRKKILNAKELLNYLLELDDYYGDDLVNVTINYRYDFDSDVESIGGVCEDIFDAETNSVLESILFYTNSND
jgi:hypothetical protein